MTALILGAILFIGGCGSAVREAATEAGMAASGEAATEAGIAAAAENADAVGKEVSPQEDGTTADQASPAQETETELDLSGLTLSKKREDYPHLTDEEFANFREITAGQIAEGRLFRSSSPISPALGRNTYADAAAESAGVVTILNLADSEEEAKAFSGYDESYYSGQKILFLPLEDSSAARDLEPDIAEGFRFLAEEEGPYLIHCKQGKDRTGVFLMITEALMGANVPEMCEDFRMTYENLYDFSDGTYRALTGEELEAADHKLREKIRETFEIETFPDEGFERIAENYLLDLGLTEDEISSIRKHLR